MFNFIRNLFTSTPKYFRQLRNFAFIMAAFAGFLLTVVNPIIALPASLLTFLTHFTAAMAAMGITAQAVNGQNTRAILWGSILLSCLAAAPASGQTYGPMLVAHEQPETFRDYSCGFTVNATTEDISAQCFSEDTFYIHNIRMMFRLDNIDGDYVTCAGGVPIADSLSQTIVIDTSQVHFSGGYPIVTIQYPFITLSAQYSPPVKIWTGALQEIGNICFYPTTCTCLPPSPWPVGADVELTYASGPFIQFSINNPLGSRQLYTAQDGYFRFIKH